MSYDPMKTAMYKGKRYQCLFVGKTKYGQKAKLSFMDGSKEFWVDADKISGVQDDGEPTSTGGRRRQSRREREEEECEVCGKNKYTCGHCVGW